MNTKHLFTKTGKKAGKSLYWMIGVLAVLLLSGGVSFAGPFVPFDDFSDSPAVINKAKWGQYEIAREISGGKLRLKARSSRHYTSPVSMNLAIQSPGSVNTIEADMTLHAYDNTEGARSQVILSKRLYNDGTGTDYLGDVTALLTIGGSSQSPIAVLVVSRFTTEDGDQTETLSAQTFSTVPVLDTPYSASITWNGSTVTGTFNGQSLTYTPVTAINPVNNPGCVLQARVDNNYANGIGKEATIEGFFDNVKKNGVAYDNFSASKIDGTKWSTYEYVREIDAGKLRLEARSSTASTATIESYLSMLRASQVKAIQAKVRLISFDNPSAASCGAQVYGRFFNDGSTGGGYTGDYQAVVALGSSGTSPAGVWVVLRYSGTGGDTGVVVDQGTFTTSISIGVDYTLSVEWDGSKFIFKIDDETIEYSPSVSTVVPANQPTKELDTLIRNNSGKEATVEALFDDVMVSQPSLLYANYTGYGLYKHNGTTWTQLNSVVATDMVASGSVVYANFAGYGLYKHNGTTWTQLNSVVSSSMVAYGSTLYANFAGYGLYKHNGTAWTRLNSVVPESMIASGSVLYANYTGYGLYKYDGSTWTRIHSLVPENMVASGFVLYTNFTGYGLYDLKYEGATWTWLQSVVPASMAVSGFDVYANYTGYGLYKYNGATWTRIHSVVPASMAVSFKP